MRYFFLAFALIVLMVISFFGFRGDLFSGTPLRIFPDMDDQDKVKTQKPSEFFADGMGSRKPVAGTVPRGFEQDGVVHAFGEGYSFGNSELYIDTGKIGQTYGDGMPDELGLKDEDLAGFLRHGKERYEISCMPCHGQAGDGKGTVAVIASDTPMGSVADLMQSRLLKAKYTDGQMFEVITKGKGLMGAYGFNIPVNDRWAIIAYVRTLQEAKNTAAK
ncbi:MAG: cytochrome c [Verrucomicrobiae bacterium]|nr:cytochrome c [Verrucomicrobiae bacterium]NNJ85553.1 cytochrome c [Akkermansiaceae bacterium]